MSLHDLEKAILSVTKKNDKGVRVTFQQHLTITVEELRNSLDVVDDEIAKEHVLCAVELLAAINSVIKELIENSVVASLQVVQGGFEE